MGWRGWDRGTGLEFPVRVSWVGFGPILEQLSGRGCRVALSLTTAEEGSGVEVRGLFPCRLLAESRCGVAPWRRLYFVEQVAEPGMMAADLGKICRSVGLLARDGVVDRHDGGGMHGWAWAVGPG